MLGYSWDDEVQDEIAYKMEGWFEHLKGLAEADVYEVQSLSSRSAL